MLTNSITNRDDWAGLNRHFLVEGFSERILTPLLPSDCSIELEVVPRAEFSSFLSKLHTGEFDDNIAHAHVHLEKIATGTVEQIISNQVSTYDNLQRIFYHNNVFLQFPARLPFLTRRIQKQFI